MKPLSVEYRRLVSIPGTYENVALGLTVRVEDGEEASSALKAAELFVDAELSSRVDGVGGLAAELDDLRRQVVSHRREKDSLEAEIATLRARHRKAREFLARFGVESGEFDDLPF